MVCNLYLVCLPPFSNRSTSIDSIEQVDQKVFFKVQIFVLFTDRVRKRFER